MSAVAQDQVLDLPLDLAKGVRNWIASTVYDIGYRVVYNQQIYECTIPHTSGVSFDVTKWGIQIGAIGAHDALDTLVHEVAETSYIEITRSSGKVSNITTWTDSGKTIKVREIVISRTGGLVSQIITKQYDAGGALIKTLTENITRTGSKVSSIDVVLA